MVIKNNMLKVSLPLNLPCSLIYMNCWNSFSVNRFLLPFSRFFLNEENIAVALIGHRGRRQSIASKKFPRSSPKKLNMKKAFLTEISEKTHSFGKFLAIS